MCKRKPNQGENVPSLQTNYRFENVSNRLNGKFVYSVACIQQNNTAQLSLEINLYSLHGIYPGLYSNISIMFSESFRSYSGSFSETNRPVSLRRCVFKCGNWLI